MNLSREVLDAHGLEKYETPDEYTKRWLTELHDKVTVILNISPEERQEIDVNRAVQGLIIKELTGDTVNTLVGALFLAQQPTHTDMDTLMIKLGFATAWQASQAALQEFESQLSSTTHDTFLNFYAMHQQFINEVVTAPEFDAKAMVKIINTGKEIRQALKGPIIQESGLDLQDLTYGYTILELFRR